MTNRDKCQHNNIFDHTSLLCILVKMDAYPTYEIVEIKTLTYPTLQAFF